MSSPSRRKNCDARRHQEFEPGRARLGGLPRDPRHEASDAAAPARFEEAFGEAAGFRTESEKRRKDQNMSTTSTPTVFDALVAEIAQNYRHGRILVAVDGADAEYTRSFANALADAARASGETTFRASAERPEQYTSDAASLLRAVLAGFREGALERDDAITEVPVDAMLIVDGRFLLNPRLRGAWHFRVWLESDATLSSAAYEQQVHYVRDDAPRAAADAIYDVSSSDAPLRVFSDSC